MAEALDALFSPTLDALDLDSLGTRSLAWKEKKSITGLLADLAMAIRSTSTNIDIGNATTSTPGKAEALL